MASIEGQYAIATHARNATSLSEQQLISWCATACAAGNEGRFKQQQLLTHAQ